MNILPFHPTPGATVSIAATTATARVLLGGQPGGMGQFQVLVTNAGTAMVFIRQGDNTVNAAVTDVPILPGSSKVFSFNVSQAGAAMGLYMAAITAALTSTIYFTTGAGF